MLILFYYNKKIYNYNFSQNIGFKRYLLRHFLLNIKQIRSLKLIISIPEDIPTNDSFNSILHKFKFFIKNELIDSLLFNCEGYTSLLR